MTDESTIKGAVRSIRPEMRMSPDEWQFVQALANAVPYQEAGEALGWSRDKSKSYAHSSRILMAVATIGIAEIHRRHAPMAIRVISGLMAGNVISLNIGPNGQQKIVSEQGVVAPAVRLAAAQTIIKLAGYEEHARKAGDGEEFDLSNATPEQLRGIVSAIESQLASTAQDVTPDDAPNAPNAPDVAHQADEKPFGFNVLDP